jgi:hypothetical protein
MTIIALIMTSVKRRRDIVDILGFDVAGKLSDDIVNGEKHCNGVPNSFSTFMYNGEIKRVMGSFEKQHIFTDLYE